MKILAIETATEACTVALRYDDQVIERFEVKARAHSLLVLPMLESVLAEADIKVSQLDAIAFGCGPGAFTGVRIAASVTQGLAFAADIPVIPVSTLVGLAQGAFRVFGLRQILPVLDARMDEVYITQCTLNQLGIMEADLPERVISPQKVELPNSGHWLGIGTGWDHYSQVLLRQQSSAVTWNPNVLPHAEDYAFVGQVLLEQGKAVSAEQAIPVYVRDQVASKPH